MKYALRIKEGPTQPGFFVIEDEYKKSVVLIDLGETEKDFNSSEEKLNTILRSLNGELTGATPGAQAFNTERLKQINHYGFDIKHHDQHAEYYADGQLAYAAQQLSHMDRDMVSNVPPAKWDSAWWLRMRDKDYKERLEIAGALLIAEYERLFCPAQ